MKLLLEIFQDKVIINQDFALQYLIL